MDPSAAYLELQQAIRARDWDTAREFAESLAQWIAKGGFYPEHGSRTAVDADLVYVLRRTGSTVPHRSGPAPE